MSDQKDIRITEEERLIPVWSIVLACLAFVLIEYYFWIVAPEQRHHTPPPRPAHLLQRLLGSRRLSLLPHGRLHQQRRAAPRHEHAFLDGHLLRHAGRHRRSSLLPAAPTPGLSLPVLRHARSRRLPLLPPVQLSAHRKLRHVLPHRPRYRYLLHQLRPRACQRPRSRAPSRAQRLVSASSSTNKCSTNKCGCPTLATSLFFWLGWDNTATADSLLAPPILQSS